MDFGDGGTQTLTGQQVQAGELASHAYEKAGVYFVSLTVSDSEGRMQYRSKALYLSDTNQPMANMTVSNLSQASTKNFATF